MQATDAIHPKSAKRRRGKEASNRQKRRPVVTKMEIVLALRRRITLGELAPGARLPTHRELRRQMNANIVTVNRAIHRLKLEGFVDPQGARGTFVCQRPPHLFRYALVFPSHPGVLPSDPSSGTWPRFWDALAKEAMAIQQEGIGEIAIYYDIDRHHASQDYHRLVDDVLSHRLAGLIFSSDPWEVKNTPLLDEPGIPRVAVTVPEADYPNVAKVILDGFAERALDHLAAKGRKRLGVLTVPGLPTEPIRQMAAARDLETRSYWIQSVASGMPMSAQACMHLMMREGQVDRPDGLLITDDNLVEHASAGLVDAGVRVPLDADVVAHCNFPWPTPSVVAVKRLGFDADHLLAASIHSIDEQRRMGKVPPLITIPAVFEDEVKRSSGPRR